MTTHSRDGTVKAGAYTGWFDRSQSVVQSGVSGDMRRPSSFGSAGRSGGIRDGQDAGRTEASRASSSSDRLILSRPSILTAVVLVGFSLLLSVYSGSWIVQAGQDLFSLTSVLLGDGFRIEYTVLGLAGPASRESALEQLQSAIERVTAGERDVDFSTDNPDAFGELSTSLGEMVSTLQERERQLSTLMSNVPGMVYRCRNDPDWPMEFVSEGARELTGYDPETLESGELSWGEDVIQADNETLWTEVQNQLDEREPFQVTFEIETADGEWRWVREQGCGVFSDDGELEALEGVIIDVTAQIERERALRSLHEGSLGLLQATTQQEATQIIVDAATEALDVSEASVYTFDANDSRLELTAHTLSTSEQLPLEQTVDISDDESPLQRAFLNGEPLVFEAGSLEESATGEPAGEQTQANPQSRSESGRETDTSKELVIVHPLGQHALLVVSASQERVDEEMRRLVETLAVTGEAAFDRIASEATVRERETELERQNRRLERQVDLNEFIRAVNASFVGATSQDEIERAVCARLVENDDITLAWIGDVDTDGESVSVRAWAGSGESYLDELSNGRVPEGEPALLTAKNARPRLVSNVVDEIHSQPWANEALSAGFGSVLAVPLTFEAYSHGVLTVYAEEPERFESLEREVFEELGETIANAMTAVRTRQVLQREQQLEVTVRLPEIETFLARVVRESGHDVTHVGIARETPTETTLFFTVKGATPEPVDEVLDELVSVTEHHLVDASNGDCVFEATVTGDVLAARLIRHGARPRSLHASREGIEATVWIPPMTDLREFLEMLETQYDDVELTSKQTVDAGAHTEPDLVSSLFENLTDRQLEVLKTAYFAGFFEWPRKLTNEELAEMLDISQPTASRHLRLSQQRLLSQLFERKGGTVGDVAPVPRDEDET